MSNLRRILSLSLVLALLGSASIFVYATEKTIPSTIPAGTILTYDEQLNPSITVDKQMQKNRITKVEKDIGNAEDLLAEETVYQKIKKNAKINETIVISYELPAPSEGMIVIYGSDGQS